MNPTSPPPPQKKKKGGRGRLEYHKSCSYYVTTHYWTNSAYALSERVILQRCLSSSFQAPSFPATTNFCNSTIGSNLRNARKSVYHLPSSHRHLYSAQLAVFIHKQEVHCKRLNVKTHTYIDPLLMALRESLPILKPRKDAPWQVGIPSLTTSHSLPTASSARHQLTQIPVAKRERRDDWKAKREALCRVKWNSSRKVRRQIHGTTFRGLQLIDTHA